MSGTVTQSDQINALAERVAFEITAAKRAVKDELLNGAGAAYDTLKELGDLIDTNKDAITALKETAAGHVKFDSAQSLSGAQKAQARTNIGAADVAVEGNLAAFMAAVGDTTTDYVAAFEAALNATE